MQFVFDTPLPDSDLPPLRVTGDAVLQEFGFDARDLPADVGYLLLLSIASLLATYLALHAAQSNLRDTILCLLHARSLGDLHSSAARRLAGPPLAFRPSFSRPIGDRPSAPGPLPPFLQAATPPSAIRNPVSEHQRGEKRDGAPDIGPPGCSTREEDRLPLESLLRAHGHAGTLAWRDLSYEVSLRGGGTRQILTLCSGVVAPTQRRRSPGAPGAGRQNDSVADAAAQGCLMGVIGPSGAGKTTLLDLLAGRIGGESAARPREGLPSGVSGRWLPVAGEVTIGGRTAVPAARRSLLKLVPQEDILPAASTVREHLLFHANLRTPRTPRGPPDSRAEAPPSEPAEKTFERACEERVDALIHALGLTKVADSLIGDTHLRGISGGEKRRVSIAVELLGSKGIVLLDEPTTGLDSTNAARVVALLRRLTDAGTSVVFSVHQPRSDLLAMLDRVLVLSPDGLTLFSGPVGALEGFLGGLGYAVPEGQSVGDFALSLSMTLGSAEVGRMAAAFRDSGRTEEEWSVMERECEEASGEGR